MVLAIAGTWSRVFVIVLLLFGLLGLSDIPESHAQQDAEQTEQSFPAINEVVPQATAVAAQILEAESQIQNLEARQAVYDSLNTLAENLVELEEQYANWENVTDWQINQLLRARASYADLAEQQTEPLDVIYEQLQTLENLRNQWEEKKAYWQKWRKQLRDLDVKLPTDAFRRTLTGIDELLKKVDQVSTDLVKTQQEYAPDQEIVASRLNTIDKTLDSIRKETFRRNTFSMFEPDYYRQFDHALWTKFSSGLIASVSLPANFFQRHSVAIGLQLAGIAITLLLLRYRKRQDKPVTDQWKFLFRRPLSGAIFIAIVFPGIFTDLYRNMPPNWRWLLLIIVTIAAMRLLNAFYEQSLTKKMIRVIAAVFILSESLRYFGLPTPLLQLYDALLCVLAIPVCLTLLRRRDQEMAKQRPVISLLLSVAVIGLVTAVFGFENLTTNLIDATLTTFILVIIIRMALRLSDNGIAAFMQLEWIRSRHFMQVLGLDEITRKLQTLLRLVILVNASLYLLVTWMIFDSYGDAIDVLFGFEYTVGEFSISVKMVVMAILVLYLATIISWIIQAFVDSQIMTPRKMEVGVRESLKRLTHYGVFTIGFLVAVSMIGLDLQKLTILAGALGVGIGFGLQNIVNNFVSGLILLFERPVKVGDVINIDQNWGTITRIGLRSTIFETFDRAEIIVPNADLISQKVTNWTFSSKIVRVTLPVGVKYGSPLERVLEILTRAAEEHPDVLSHPAASPIFVGFGNSSIDFELRVWIHSIDDRLKIFSELGVLVDRLFREEGIEIPFPQRDLHLRSIDTNLQTLFDPKTPKSPNATEGQTE